MSVTDSSLWQVLGEVYGFIGNSLLKPMSQTPTVGLDPEFWDGFPRLFDNERVDAALTKLKAYAETAADMDEAKAVERVAVEYTRLFIGPPSPAAPPWETMSRADGVSVGFGEATFQMKAILREAGLELSNENNQYEDHMGIELLYLSEMCRRIAAGEPSVPDAGELGAFVEEHPLSWIETLRGRVESERADGYYAGLLELAHGVLEWHEGQLAEQ